MRILFLTPRFPLPTVKGDKLRSWQMIRQLSERYDIKLLCYYGNDDERSLIPEVEKYCSVEALPFNIAYGGIGLLKGFLSPKPFQVHLYESRAMREKVAENLGKSDFIFLGTIRMAGNLPRDFDPPRLVVDFIDALSLNFERRLKSSNALTSPLIREEMTRLREYEKYLAAKADLGLAVSPRDAGEIGNGIVTLPLSLDTMKFHPPDNNRKRKDIIFSGNLSYTPNVEASVYMAEEIMPIILKSIPGTRLRLVGANPSGVVRALNSESVEVTGFVENIADEIRKSAVAVAPLQSGAGIQTKVLEAMGCATPVVATGIANAGIMARDGFDILLADDRDTFAERVISLLSKQQFAEEIGNNGRSFVVDNFSRESIGSRLLTLFSNIESGEKGERIGQQ